MEGSGLKGKKEGGKEGNKEINGEGEKERRIRVKGKKGRKKVRKVGR